MDDQRLVISRDNRILLDFAEHPIGEWLLELNLLERGLAESLTVLGDGPDRLKITLDDTVAREDRAICEWTRECCPMLRVGMTEFEYWSQFFGEYYRDGVAAVDHIDVEARNLSAGEHRILVTLKVGKAKQPVSVSEARGRLGLPR